MTTDEIFNNLCREFGIHGTAEARLCRVFWLGGLAYRRETFARRVAYRIDILFRRGA